jgi:hypothetical protein
MLASPSRRRKSTGLPPRRRCEFRCGPSGWNRRTEARLCSTFLGTVERTEPRPCCALLSMAAPNSRRAIPDARCGSLSRRQVMRNVDLVCRSLGLWHRQEAESLLGSDASLSSSIPHLLGHCFGAFATPGGKLALLLRFHHPVTQQSRAWDPGFHRPSGYGFHLRWTLRKCRASALGVAPTRIASPGVTRADREFKSGDSQCI